MVKAGNSCGKNERGGAQGRGRAGEKLQLGFDQKRGLGSGFPRR